MAVTYRNAAHAQTGGATALTVAKPTNTAEGDTLLVTLATFGNEGAVTTPAGWAAIGARQAGSTGQMHTQWFIKVAGASEPANYTFQWAAACPANVTCAAYPGADTATPTGALVMNKGNGTPLVIPSVTPTKTGGLLIALMANYIGSFNAAPSGSGWVRDYTDAGASNGGGHYGTALTAGTPTASVNWGIGGGDWAVLALELVPLGAGGTGTVHTAGGAAVGTGTPSVVPSKLAGGAGASAGLATPSLVPVRLADGGQLSALGAASPVAVPVVLRAADASALGAGTPSLAGFVLAAAEAAAIGRGAPLVVPSKIASGILTSQGAGAATLAAQVLAVAGAAALGTGLGVVEPSVLAVGVIEAGGHALGVGAADARPVVTFGGEGAARGVATPQVEPVRVLLAGGSSVGAGAASLVPVRVLGGEGASRGQGATAATPVVVFAAGAGALGAGEGRVEGGVLTLASLAASGLGAAIVEALVRTGEVGPVPVAVVGLTRGATAGVDAQGGATLAVVVMARGPDAAAQLADALAAKVDARWP